MKNIIKKIWHKDTKAFLVFLLLCCLVLAFFSGLAQLAKNRSPFSIRISSTQAEQIQRWYKKCPSIQPVIKMALEDEQITNEEYLLIRDTYVNQLTKDSIADTKKKQN